MALVAAIDLLVERKGEIRMQKGGVYPLINLRGVDEAKLNALPDEDCVVARGV